MTKDELIAAVLASPEAKAKADIGADADVAAIVSEALPDIGKYTPITKRTIYGLFGLQRGVEIRLAIKAAGESNPVLAELLSLLDDVASGGIDVGHRDAAKIMETLVQIGIIKQSEADTLNGLAKTRPGRITADQVSAALAQFRPEGKAVAINGK